MSRGVRSLLFGSTAIAALGVLAGCGHYWFGEREAWRREAEVACINSGVVKETPERVRISAINGPGICGADFPLRVSALGDSAPLGYDDEPLRPPGNIPSGAMPPRWPVVQSRSTPAAGRPRRKRARRRLPLPPPRCGPRRKSGRRYRLFRQAPPNRMKTIWATNPIRRVPMTARPPRARRLARGGVSDVCAAHPRRAP